MEKIEIIGNMERRACRRILSVAVALMVWVSASAAGDVYSQRMSVSQGKAWSADKSWDYVSGLVANSLLMCSEQYPEESWAQNAYAWAKTFADNSLNADGTFVKFGKGSLDNIAPGKVLVRLANATAESNPDASARYKGAAQYLYEYLRNEYPRITKDEGYGGFYHKDKYPNQMWLDGLYMGAAFMADWLAAYAPDDTDAWTDIADQFWIVHQHTRDTDKGLNYHGWSADPTDWNSFWATQSGPYKGCSAEFWGRGMGWYFAALVDVLAVFPREHPDFEMLSATLEEVAAGLALYQDAGSGVWYQLLQYDSTFTSNQGRANYLEASASCMFTYAYLKAIRLGLLDESYLPMATRAYQGLLDTFISENSNGTISINYICRSAGLGPAFNWERDGSASYYLDGSDVGIVSNEGKGIGTFIMASLEYELLQTQGSPSVWVDTPVNVNVSERNICVAMTTAQPFSAALYTPSGCLVATASSVNGSATLTAPAAGVYIMKIEAEGPDCSLKIVVE